MSRIRTLRDLETGKIWATRCEGARTMVRAGAPDREKETPKQHADAAAAERWAAKEEWARLKKGMVLLDPDAGWGEPRLHRFIGGAYTGAMAIAPAQLGGFVYNRFGDADEMVHVGPNATVTTELMLPANRLVWKAASAAALGVVLLQVDGGILRWSPADGAAEEVSPYRPTPGFLSVAGTRASWYDGSHAVVRDLAVNADLLRLPIQPQMYGGHSHQMEGTLSPDGRLLALCAKPGEVLLYDVDSGSLRAELRGDFAMVRQFDFLSDGRLLLAEQYGRWSLRCLDVETGLACADWPELSDIGTAAIAVSPSGRRVVVAGRSEASVYETSIHETGTARPPRRFALDHVVKRCAATWLGEDALAIRTDYGCASIYAVP